MLFVNMNAVLSHIIHKNGVVEELMDVKARGPYRSCRINACKSRAVAICTTCIERWIQLKHFVQKVYLWLSYNCHSAHWVLEWAALAD